MVKLRKISETHPYLQEELAFMTEAVEEEMRHQQGRGILDELKELKTPDNRKRIILGVLIFTFMQWAGSNAINYYSPRIFESLGLVGSSTGLYATGIYGIVRLISVFIAMYWAVDRLGRRNMLMGGAAVMAFSMWFIGAYIKIDNPEDTGLNGGAYAAVVFIYIYAVGFCFSYAGIPWIYCAEIFPSRIRASGMAICTATHVSVNTPWI
jgi:MFS family permease